MTKIDVIPCLEDNYGYIVRDEKKRAILIDAPEAAPINARIEAEDLTIEAVLLTHHHDDHVRGLLDIEFGNAPVIGAHDDQHRLPPLSIYVKHGEKVKQASERFHVLAADGHTIGHIAFYFEELGALFSGDSLMLWGCGRLFEGTAEEMWATLERFMALPPETLIYSGHNYGEVNGRFALSLGGYSARMEARMAKIRQQNATGEPVVPVTLQEEMETNPFLLARDDDYAAELGIADLEPVARFAHIRKLRDGFSG